MTPLYAAPLRPHRVALGLAVIAGALAWCAAGLARGQTTIDVPPAFPPRTISAGTTLNLRDGGYIYTLHGESGSQINILGGEGGEVSSAAGAQINVLGGSIGTLHVEGSGVIAGGGVGSFINWGGATTTVTGGAIDSIRAQQNSALNLQGASFQINGVPVAGLSTVGDSVAIDLAAGDILTGILASGAPLAHAEYPFGGSVIEPGVLTLTRSADPPPPTPGVISVTGDSDLAFVGAGQTAVVAAGGRLHDHFRAGPGSRVELDGGVLGYDFHAIGAEVVINSGVVLHDLVAFPGSEVTIRGGGMNDSTIHRDATLNVEGGEYVGTLRSGATMNVTGGRIVRVYGSAGSTSSIRGGRIDDFSTQGRVDVTGGNFEQFNVQEGTADVRGGVFNDDFFEIRIDAGLNLHASEFRLNGAALPNLNNVGDSRTITLAANDVLSGVFSDGTPFVFSGSEGRIEEPINLVRSADYSPGPATFRVPSDAAPAGLHAGQSLTLAGGGALPENFTAGYGSSVRVEGGTVGPNFDVVGARADITGGALNTIDAFVGAEINIGGNANWAGLDAYRGAVVNIAGGVYNGGHFFRAYEGATVNISGGQFRYAVDAQNATINVSGGEGLGISASTNSRVTQSGGDLAGVSLYDGASLTTTGGSIESLGVNNASRAEIDGARIKRLQVTPGAVVEVDGGSLTELDNVGGTAHVRGGALGDNHEWIAGLVELEGYDFRVNGAPVPGLANVGDSTGFSYVAGTTFSGILADGTPFMMSPSDQSHVLVTQGQVRLKQSAPAVLPAVVRVPSDPVPFGAGAGQTVLVTAGGQLYDNFSAGDGSVVEIRGGAVGANFEAFGSDVTIAAGAVGEYLDVFDGAAVALSGGTVDRHWEIHRGGSLSMTGGRLDFEGRVVGGELNVSGGEVAGSVDAEGNATINVSGGKVGNELNLSVGSIAHVSGGEVGANFQVFSSSTASVTGGRLRGLELKSAGQADISGGLVEGFHADGGATVQVSGGAFGDSFVANSAAEVTLYGAQFEIDGVSVPNVAQAGDEALVAIVEGQLFAGTLADGTPFAFHSREGDQLRNVRLRYQTPVAGPATITIPSDAAPLGVHQGQELAVLAGGSVGEHFSAGRGSVVNVQGGSVGRNFEAYQATVNLSAGQIAGEADAFTGTQFNVSGGLVQGTLDVYSQAALEVSGGLVSGARAQAGSAVSLHGGKIGTLNGEGASRTDWSGGVVDAINMSATSTLEVSGVNFKLNGAPVAGLDNVGDAVAFTLPTGGTLTATLADGTPLVLSRLFQNVTLGGTTRLVRSAAPPAPSPALVQVSSGVGPFALRSGQTLELSGAGQLPNNFIAGDQSVLKIAGGTVGPGFKALGAEVEITGGTLAGMTLLEDAHVDILGGSVSGNGLSIMAGASVDIYGTQFRLNGQPIGRLGGPGATRVLNERGNFRFTAVLADGSTLDWPMAPPQSPPRGPIFGISPAATITLHVIPEPACLAMAAVAMALVPLLTKRRR